MITPSNSIRSTVGLAVTATPLPGGHFRVIAPWGSPVDQKTLVVPTRAIEHLECDSMVISSRDDWSSLKSVRGNVIVSGWAPKLQYIEGHCTMSAGASAPSLEFIRGNATVYLPYPTDNDPLPQLKAIGGQVAVSLRPGEVAAYHRSGPIQLMGSLIAVGGGVNMRLADFAVSFDRYRHERTRLQNCEVPFVQATAIMESMLRRTETMARACADEAFLDNLHEGESPGLSL